MDYFKKALIVPINTDNEILIQDRRGMDKKYKMDWGWFGGSIEEGETPVQAVIRETLEELSIKLNPSQLTYIGRFDDVYKDEAKIERDVYLWFMGNTTIKDLVQREGKAMKFISIEEAKNLMILKGDKWIPSIVQQYLAGRYNIKIANKYNELLDVLIEGASNKKVLLFVHGLGTNKDEGLGLFKDLSQALSKDFKIIRFDFSGYGESGGKDEDSNLDKAAQDLATMVNFSKANFNGDHYLIAHSMGTYAVGKLSPDGFKRTILTGVPNDTPDCSIERLAERIRSRKGGILDFNGISTYPRTSDEIQRIGPSFWTELRKYNVFSAMLELEKKTELTIIHPLQDEIIGNEHLEGYRILKRAKFLEIDGDHSWSKPEERKRLINIIKEILD